MPRTISAKNDAPALEMSARTSTAGAAQAARPRRRVRRSGIQSASSRTKNVIGATLVGITRRPAAAQRQADVRRGRIERRRVRREPAPADRAREAEPVEHLRVVLRDSARENRWLPCAGRRFETLQLPDDFERAALADRLGARGHVLPVKQPPHEDRRRDRRNRPAELADGQPMNPREEPALAPLDRGPAPADGR